MAAGYRARSASGRPRPRSAAGWPAAPEWVPPWRNRVSLCRCGRTSRPVSPAGSSGRVRQALAAAVSRETRPDDGSRAARQQRLPSVPAQRRVRRCGRSSPGQIGVRRDAWPVSGEPHMIRRAGRGGMPAYPAPPAPPVIVPDTRGPAVDTPIARAAEAALQAQEWRRTPVAPAPRLPDHDGRQPEGRSRQDHDDREYRRGACAARVAGAGDRPGSAGKRLHRTGRGSPRGHAFGVQRPSSTTSRWRR